MKYAVVAPIDVLENLPPHVLGDYHLWLAHEVLQHPERWRRLAIRLGQEVGPQHIIMDNSVNETVDKKPLGIEATVEAAQYVGAQVVVLPDTLRDRWATYEAAREAAHYVRNNAPTLKVMGVAQGASVSDYLACTDLLEQLDLDWYSLPKGYSEYLPDNPPRRYTTQALAMRLKRPMHTLGFTDHMYDDIYTAVVSQGIDSAMPVWLGLSGIRLGPELPNKPTPMGRRPDYRSLRPFTAEGLDAAAANIRQVREWLNGAANERWGVGLGLRTSFLAEQRENPRGSGDSSGNPTA